MKYSQELGNDTRKKSLNVKKGRGKWVRVAVIKHNL